VTFTAASLNGNLSSLGTAGTVDVSFVWGTSQYGPYPNSTPPQPKTVGEAFTADLTGLDPSTTFFFRARADGGAHGVTYGDQASFSTPPSVVTEAATDIEETTATLNGTVTDDGGEACQYRFQYDTDSGEPYAYQTAWTGSKTTGQSFSEAILGLDEGKKYYFRAQAKNDTRGTSSGAEVTFLTKPDPPTGLSAAAASISRIDLSWTEGDGAGRTLIVRKEGGYPVDRGDGSEVYFGRGTSTSDMGLSQGTTCYYRAWSEVTGSRQWSDEYDEAQATTGVTTATGTGTATFTASSGTIADLTAIARATITCPAPLGLAFPHGFFSFNITNIPPGSTVTITITLPWAMPVGTQYWKCQNGAWVDVTSLLGDNDGDNVLTLTLTDGGLGDADVTANGTIVDPGGPAVPPGEREAPPTMPDGASTGGEPPMRVTPPDLKPKYLSVNPRQAHPDQPVTVLTNVVNRGGMEGSYIVNLMINGQLEQRKMVVVGPGATQPVQFTISKAQPGTYTVAIGGNRARFTVIGADRVGSVGPGSGLVLAVATFVLVVLAGLLLLVVRKRFQAG